MHKDRRMVLLRHSVWELSPRNGGRGRSFSAKNTKKKRPSEGKTFSFTVHTAQIRIYIKNALFQISHCKEQGIPSFPRAYARSAHRADGARDRKLRISKRKPQA